MKLVIDIPDKMYETVQNDTYCGTLYEELKNGTPLSESEDCVSRQAVLDAMYELCDTGGTLKENPWRDNPHIDAITDVIDDLPPVTPTKKVGHWIDVDGIWFECSECGANRKMRPAYKEHYCPYCGAKMQEVEE